MSATNNKIAEMITEQGWNAETATELVLEYLRQKTKPHETLDVLIAGVLSRGGEQGLLSFLQDCVMTGSDHDVARYVADRKLYEKQ